MTLEDSIEAIESCIPRVFEQLHTEQAIKTVLIVPVIEPLRYDSLNPTEAATDYTAAWAPRAAEAYLSLLSRLKSEVGRHSQLRTQEGELPY